MNRLITVFIFVSMFSALSSSVGAIELEEDNLDSLDWGDESEEVKEDDLDSLDWADKDDVDIDAKKTTADTKLIQDKLYLSTTVGLESHYRLKTDKNTANDQNHGFVDAQLKLQLEVDYRFLKGWRIYADAYSLRHSHNDQNIFLSGDEQVYPLTETEIGEAYLEGGVGNVFDFYIGRRIQTIGRSDYIRLLNSVNSLDLRQPGIISIADQALPVTLSKGSYYLNNHRFSLMAIHESRFNKIPPFVDKNVIEIVKPEEKLSNTEYIVEWTGEFQQSDLSVYYLKKFDDALILNNTNGQPPFLFYQWQEIIGFAGSAVLGNCLLKAEIAQGDVKGALLGGDFTHFSDTTLSFEVAYQDSQRVNFRDNDKSFYEGVVGFRKTLLHSRLLLNGIRKFNISNGGGFSRFFSEYQLSDKLILKAGLVLYHQGDGMPHIGDQDRFIVGFNYSH